MNLRAKALIVLMAGIIMSFAAVAQTPKFKRGELQELLPVDP